MRATRERAELVVEPRVVPGVLLLRCLLTAGRRRGVEDNGRDGEDKPTPADPMSGGVGVAQRGVNPSGCGGEFV